MQPMDDALNTAPCGVFSFTDDGTLVAVNGTLAEMLGYGTGELVGGRVESFLTLASRMFYQTHLFPMLRMQGKAEEIFLSLRSRSGESIPVLLNAVRKEHEGGVVNQCALIPVRNRGKYEDELLAAKRTAEEALRNNEELTRARRELELHARELDQKLSRLEQKNQELTRISTILSHDLREPIRKLSMFSSLFTQQDRQVLSATGQRSLDRIKLQSARMEQLVMALQEFVSLDDTQEPLEDVELGDVVGGARQLVTERAGTMMELRSEPLPVLQGRRRQLMMLFFQLLDNSVKFRRPEESPRIGIECHVIQHNTYRANTGRYHYTDFARILYADNGMGFDNRYSDYVFEALKKLDPDSPGQGIGLAICRKVVENHNGSISVESEPGRGTRFTLLLPLRQ
ncbi:MAG TPA: ATP-binding protein [Archangium sp.]|uniref:sensor histidine kinase n=1 Tax=Archangium sp. TaxID=1872627 RepID=UPI002E3347E2|nr:ATP-binding protein [Archangium sp.]HEX5746470.1 ATP-binding protein [Archangium sp.]